jgi:hypothetical protein
MTSIAKMQQVLQNERSNVGCWQYALCKTTELNMETIYDW